MRLSQNFTLGEFTASETASRRGIDNTAPPEAVANLQALCLNVLQPLRSHFGKPITITSGYRSPTLNKAVGGARQSQHMKGEAADFIVQGVPLDEVFEWITANLVFDQLIREPSWIHVSFREGQNRRQAFRLDQTA